MGQSNPKSDRKGAKLFPLEHPQMANKKADVTIQEIAYMALDTFVKLVARSRVTFFSGRWQYISDHFQAYSPQSRISMLVTRCEKRFAVRVGVSASMNSAWMERGVSFELTEHDLCRDLDHIENCFIFPLMTSLAKQCIENGSVR